MAYFYHEETDVLDTSRLLDALDDEYWYARAEAALALGKIGDSQAASRLFQMLDDPDEFVRDNARVALQDLATDENKPASTKKVKPSVQVPRQIRVVVGSKPGLKLVKEQSKNSSSRVLFGNMHSSVCTSAQVPTPSASLEQS